MGTLGFSIASIDYPISLSLSLTSICHIWWAVKWFIEALHARGRSDVSVVVIRHFPLDLAVFKRRDTLVVMATCAVLPLSPHLRQRGWVWPVSMGRGRGRSGKGFGLLPPLFEFCSQLLCTDVWVEKWWSVCLRLNWFVVRAGAKVERSRFPPYVYKWKGKADHSTSQCGQRKTKKAATITSQPLVIFSIIAHQKKNQLTSDIRAFFWACTNSSGLQLVFIDASDSLINRILWFRTSLPRRHGGRGFLCQ